MKQNFYLSGETGRRLYEAAGRLPIVDYHCHLSPEEIYRDEPFENLCQLWLSGDHYKWRLMRAAGISEEYITGGASDYEKYLKYAECVSLAAGNPLQVWTAMELSMYFGIETPLNPETAPAIWEETCARMKQERISPRRLMEQSNVEWVVTTDDPVDSLSYHRQLAEDASFQIRVTPAFRTDRLLNLRAPGWQDYIAVLSDRAGVEIRDLDTLEQALKNRLDVFCALGCRLSDVGIEGFPSVKSTREEADAVLRAALRGEAISPEQHQAFLWPLYHFLAGEYRSRGIVMQYHLAVKRNANSALLAACGPDTGGDCVGDPIPQSEVIALLDSMHSQTGLPRTILYTLNPAMYMTLATAAGSFRGVTLGAAWWYNDHKAGIEEQLRIFGQVSHLAAFTGMLTDSRSFLSYARHDYFRRIFCSLLGEWVDAGELEETAAFTLVQKVCHDNSLALVNGK